MTSQFKYGILCDQVRREDTGKLMIIGTYGPSINTARLPIQMKITLLVAFDFSTTGSHVVNVEALFNEKKLLEGFAHISVTDPGIGFVPMADIPLNLETAGELTFVIKLDEGPNIEAWRGRVIDASNPSASGS